MLLHKRNPKRTELTIQSDLSTANLLADEQLVRDFVRYVLLSGIRVKASLRIEPSDVLGTDLHVRAEISKTEHTVDMTVSPMLTKLVARRPWEGHTYGSLEAARRRLRRYGAPAGWGWHGLRRACGTFLVAMPTLGSSSIIFASQQLGHSAEVAVSCAAMTDE